MTEEIAGSNPVLRPNRKNILREWDIRQNLLNSGFQVRVLVGELPKRKVNVSRTVTQFYEYEGTLIDLDGPHESHHAHFDTRKTFCGLNIGVYSDGWIWGCEDPWPTCEKCEKIAHGIIH